MFLISITGLFDLTMVFFPFLRELAYQIANFSSIIPFFTLLIIFSDFLLFILTTEL